MSTIEIVENCVEITLQETPSAAIVIQAQPTSLALTSHSTATLVISQGIVGPRGPQGEQGPPGELPTTLDCGTFN